MGTVRSYTAPLGSLHVGVFSLRHSKAEINNFKLGREGELGGRGLDEEKIYILNSS